MRRFLEEIADFTQGFLLLGRKPLQPVQKIAASGKTTDVGKYDSYDSTRGVRRFKISQLERLET